MKLNRNESILISLFSLGLLFLYQHYWKATKTHEIEFIRQKSEVARIEINKVETLFSKLTKRDPASKNMDSFLKLNDRFSSVVTNIVMGSKNNSFLLTKITNESQKKVYGYTQTLYNLEAEASFISIGKFLENLEESTLLTEVQSIDILRMEKEMKKCKVSIKLYSYLKEGGK